MRAALLVLGLAAVGCAAPDPDRVDRIALYSGVDGVCYSTTAVKHGRFPRFPLHEQGVVLDAVRLEELFAGLEVAGFFQETGRPLPPYSLPPMCFRMCAVRRGVGHECTFYHRRGYQVPERYLELFDALSGA